MTTVFTFTSLPFNTPKTIKGVGFMSLSFVTESAGIYGVCKLQHWDGTTATDITGSATSASVSGSDPPKVGTVYVEIPITVQKQFKKGDMVRAVISVTSGSNAYFGHSPNDAVGIYDMNTRTIIGVPFDLGL